MSKALQAAFVTVLLMIGVVGLYVLGSNENNSQTTSNLTLLQDDPQPEGEYINYSSDIILGMNHNVKRVLFFYDVNEETSVKFDQELRQQTIPQGFSVIRVDMAKDKAITKQFDVQAPAIFKLLNREGDEVRSWDAHADLESAAELLEIVKSS